jgi:hypothetical protein
MAQGKAVNSEKEEVTLIRQGTDMLCWSKTQYVLPDGWLYPLLASFRMLLDWPKNGKGPVKWAKNPYEFFSEHGPALVSFLVDRSEELGRNPNATGKSKGVWLGLRDMVEKWLLGKLSRLRLFHNREKRFK